MMLEKSVKKKSYVVQIESPDADLVSVSLSRVQRKLKLVQTFNTS